MIDHDNGTILALTKLMKQWKDACKLHCRPAMAIDIPTAHSMFHPLLHSVIARFFTWFTPAYIYFNGSVLLDQPMKLNVRFWRNSLNEIYLPKARRELSDESTCVKSAGFCPKLNRLTLRDVRGSFDVQREERLIERADLRARIIRNSQRTLASGYALFVHMDIALHDWLSKARR